MQRKQVFLSVVKRTRDFVTRAIVQVERYLSHCSCKGKYLPHANFLFCFNNFEKSLHKNGNI
ncbi:UNVERIFIED_CONTAM: hypothetical protein NCL1_55298 [Trichonephila clavipes]